MPIYRHLLLVLELNPPTLASGAAEEVLETVQKSPRFTRLRKYVEENAARPSTTKGWNKVGLLKCLYTGRHC